MDNTLRCINGELKLGDLVLSVPTDDYACLVGTVIEINRMGTPEYYAETDIPSDSIHVNFQESEYSQHRIQEIEGMLSELFSRPTTYDEHILDDVIMPPEHLIRITDVRGPLLRAILDSREAAEIVCELAQTSPHNNIAHQIAENAQNQDVSLTEKLYSPLTFYVRDNEDAEEGVYDEMDYWRDEISHDEAYGYFDEMRKALAEDRQFFDSERGLAEYLRGPLNDKVQSLVPEFELHGDRLWTVAHIQLNEPLTAEEKTELLSWWEGQISDGWGESFEQKEIEIDRGELYVEPWTSSNGFPILTQVEFDRYRGIEPAAVEVPAAAQPATLREQSANIDNILESIARKSLHIETLKTRRSDSLDFHDVSVWSLKAALTDAFNVGVAHGISREATARLSVPEVPVDGQSQRDALFARIDQDFSERMTVSRDIISNPAITDKELLSCANKLSDLNDAHIFLKNEYDFNEQELSTLMKLEHPLDAIASDWPYISAYMEKDEGMRETLANVKNLTDEPLFAPATKENIRAADKDALAKPKSGKPSLLEELRKGHAKSEQQKKTTSPEKSEPER